MNAKNIGIIAAVPLACALLGLTVFAAVKLTDHQTKRNVTKACPAGGPDHAVIISAGKVTPAQVEASRCDRLTIVNEDAESRLIAFGPHDKHESYDGVTERLLTTGQNFTVTLVRSGSFRFHDHLHDQVAGTFTVTDR